MATTKRIAIAVTAEDDKVLKAIKRKLLKSYGKATTAHIFRMAIRLYDVMTP